jgi:hypothetical protein
VSVYNAVTDRVIISPEGKSMTITEMEGIFDRAGVVSLDYNLVARHSTTDNLDYDGKLDLLDY